jgi:hypothetical protein
MFGQAGPAIETIMKVGLGRYYCSCPGAKI